jgi:hypothetical protein
LKRPTKPTTCSRAGRRGCDVFTVKKNLTTSATVQAGADVESRGLPGPVGPDQTRYPANWHIEAEGVDSNEAAELN